MAPMAMMEEEMAAEPPSAPVSRRSSVSSAGTPLPLALFDSAPGARRPR